MDSSRAAAPGLAVNLAVGEVLDEDVVQPVGGAGDPVVLAGLVRRVQRALGVVDALRDVGPARAS